MATLVWASYHVGSQIGEARGERNYHAANYERHAEEEIRERCFPLGGADQTECISDVVKATNEHQRSEDDLVAQLEMATWAFGMFLVSGIAAIITTVGVYFVWRTLDQTAKANESALKASSAAKVANELMQRSQRPWLTVSIRPCGDLRMSVKEAILPCSILIKNVGKVPATDIAVDLVAYDVFDYSPVQPIWDARKKQLSDATSKGTSFVVLPNDTVEVKRGLRNDFRELPDSSDEGDDRSMHAFLGALVIVTYREFGEQEVWATPFMGMLKRDSPEGIFIPRNEKDRIHTFSKDELVIINQTKGIGPS